MDLYALLRLLTRRWAVVAPVLAVTAIAGVLVIKSIAPLHAASGTWVLVPQDAAAAAAAQRGEPVATGAGVNPFMQLGPSAAKALAEFAAAPSFAGAVSQQARGGYQVAADDLALLLRVTATGPDEQTARQTYDAVFRTLQERLTGVQRASGADPGSWLKLNPILGPETRTDTQGLLPLLAALAVLGGLAAVSSALLVDGFMQRRTRAADPLAPSLDGDVRKVERTPQH